MVRERQHTHNTRNFEVRTLLRTGKENHLGRRRHALDASAHAGVLAASGLNAGNWSNATKRAQ